MEQDHQVPRTLVEHAIAHLCEAHAQLPKLSLDLRSGRKLWRRVTRIAAVQMLLDSVIDLRDGKGLRLQQLLQEIVDWLPPVLVAVEDGLCTPRSLCDTGTHL